MWAAPVPAHLTWHVTVRPALGAAVEGDWVPALELGCPRISGVQTAVRWHTAARGLGLRAGQEEMGFQWPASVTSWVPAALSLGNSGPRDGQEVGFLVSGVLEQVS